jgi:hypothetical protein
MTHPEFKDGSCLWLGALDPHPNPPPFQARHCAVLDRQRGRAEGSYGGRGLGLVLLRLRTLKD